MALIRCSKCGNLASSKSANCPTCGAPIGTVEQSVQPTAAEPKVATVAEPKTEPVAEPKAESAPRTLNDILRERSAQTTLGDAYLEDKSTESPAAETPAPQPP
jgi:hypothetical protein